MPTRAWYRQHLRRWRAARAALRSAGRLGWHGRRLRSRHRTGRPVSRTPDRPDGRPVRRRRRRNSRGALDAIRDRARAVPRRVERLGRPRPAHAPRRHEAGRPRLGHPNRPPPGLARTAAAAADLPWQPHEQRQSVSSGVLLLLHAEGLPRKARFAKPRAVAKCGQAVPVGVAPGEYRLETLTIDEQPEGSRSVWSAAGCRRKTM